MLQQDRLLSFLAAANARGWRVEVETNGTIAPSAGVVALVDQFNVSPKLANSAVAPDERLVGRSLAAYARCGRAVFKFVVEEVADIDEVDVVVARHGLRPVYLMPQATEAAGVVAGMRRVAEAAAERGYSLSPRLHILLWGNARGR
jgi:7-carboxy-7-deazaguanine synthase